MLLMLSLRLNAVIKTIPKRNALRIMYIIVIPIPIIAKLTSMDKKITKYLVITPATLYVGKSDPRTSCLLA